MGMGQCPRNREAMGGCGRQAENSQLSLDPPVIASGRISIENACKAFLTEGQEHAAFATQKKYRLMLAKFRAFSANRGYTLIDQWGPSDVRDFRSSWSISPQTAQRSHEYAEGFFRILPFQRMGRTQRREANQEPERQGCRRPTQRTKTSLYRRRHQAHVRRLPNYGTKPTYKWTGDDLADFISLSIYTGLRISDVALFHIDRMQPTGEILIRTTKAGTHVYTWVPDWLQERIRARAQ